MLVELEDTRVDNVPTRLRLELKNSNESSLNMDLPAGRAAIWTKDPETNSRLQVGQGLAENTAGGEPFRIEMSGSLSVDGKWVQMREAKDNLNRRLIEGDLTLKNRRSIETKVEVLFLVPGNPDVRVEVNGKRAEQKSAKKWAFEVVLGPLEEKKLTIRTRP
jgi:hypothetical protein